MATVHRQKEVVSEKLEKSKQISYDLFSNWQILTEKIMTLIENIDTSSVEDIEYANSIIDKLNTLVDSLSNEKTEFSKFKYINLTDEYGNVATEYKLWVCGQFILVKGQNEYYKRRIVRARTPKEAVYKYTKVDNSLGNNLSCLGIKDAESEYSLGIENEEIIE